MILFLAYGAVILCLLSGGLALLMRQQRSLLRLGLYGLDKIPNLPQYCRQILNDSLAELNYPDRIQRVVFILLGASGVFAVIAGLSVLISQSVETDRLSFGLPWLPWHVRFDSLSGLFYLIIGIAVTAVSLYGPGYVKGYDEQQHPFAVLGLFSGFFIAGMLMVLLADDAFFFMIAWEMMSVASYFLVAFQHEHPDNRRAAFLYLIMAQVGALFIILSFGVITSFAEGYSFTFDALRTVELSTSWASIAFVLAFLGFGMKAGLVPMHVWLPEAHPVAPSHISALMSGVMLKVALYGLIRFSFDLLEDVHSQWGVALMIVGAFSALGGIFYALMQPNLKRLLAYSSVENMGIIFMVLGLSMIFKAQGQPHLAALGFVAALFHAFNHALFKNLLFLSAGVIQHQIHELNIDRPSGQRITPFVIKGTSRISLRETTNNQFNLEHKYGQAITGTYPISASIYKEQYSSNDTGSNRKKINALENTLNYYKTLSAHYAFSSSLGDKAVQEVGILEMPSIFYGSSIKKGTVDLQFFVTTLLVRVTYFSHNGFQFCSRPLFRSSIHPVQIRDSLVI